MRMRYAIELFCAVTTREKNNFYGNPVYKVCINQHFSELLYLLLGEKFFCPKDILTCVKQIAGGRINKNHTQITFSSYEDLNEKIYPAVVKKLLGE